MCGSTLSSPVVHIATADIKRRGTRKLKQKGNDEGKLWFPGLLFLILKGKYEMKAISVEELSKTFSGGTVAVDGIRFSLNQGEIFGFLGPNGAGNLYDIRAYEQGSLICHRKYYGTAIYGLPEY